MKERELSTIVYVDDESDIREIVAMSLGLVDGVNVHTLDSGELALQALPQLRPDLVLLDVMMPGLDGPATLKRMRAQPQTADIPVVFMTAKAMPQEVAQLTELGAVAVIAKPFDPMQLGNQVLAIWRGLSNE